MGSISADLQFTHLLKASQEVILIDHAFLSLPFRIIHGFHAVEGLAINLVFLFRFADHMQSTATGGQ